MGDAPCSSDGWDIWLWQICLRGRLQVSGGTLWLQYITSPQQNY